MAFSTGTSNGLSSEINVTPLIDVLLVLLIIFMVIGPVRPRGLNSLLPPAAAASNDEAANCPILVQIEQGETSVRYLVDGVELKKAEIAPRLLELLSRRPDRVMLLKADAELDFNIVTGAIDAGQAAGADRSVW